MAPSSSVGHAIRNIWLSLFLPENALSRLRFSGDPDSAIPSSFKLGAAAQASISLAGLSAAHLLSLQTGAEHYVSVDARHAVLQFRSEAWCTVDGRIPDGNMWDDIAGLYKTKDSGYVRIHTNFPHHRRGILDILRLPDSPSLTKVDVSEALLKWDAIDFETEAASRGMCATAMRSFSEWDQHPQAKSLIGTPPVSLIKIGDAPKRQILPGIAMPSEGIRVLDLTRILAGPIAGRTLATQGADVLLISSPNLPSLPLLDIGTSLGKRTTQLDLTLPTDRETLTTLVEETDVFLQAYRPGGLEEKGFGPKNLATLRPGIICANLTAWGWNGPWKDRKGFDSLVQTATGFNVAEGKAYQEFEGLNDEDSISPRPLPMQALDHAAAYLLAFGINAALCKTFTEGGSWEVRVSLAAVGQWIRSLGRLDPIQGFRGEPFPPRVYPPHLEIANLSVPWRQSGVRGGIREMTAIKEAALMSETPAKEGMDSEAPLALDVHSATWIPRRRMTPFLAHEILCAMISLFKNSNTVPRLVHVLALAMDMAVWYQAAFDYCTLETKEWREPSVSDYPDLPNSFLRK